MSSTFKRVLTDELHDSLAASSVPPTIIDDDLTARLRSVGSRVRKNVLEGYITAPSSFSKSVSTGTIFQSARDTLREAQSFSRTHSFSNDTATQKKRLRSQGGDQGYDSDGAIDEEKDEEMNQDNNIETSLAAEGSDRPIKALRKPRKGMLQTRSLPATAFTFNNTKPMDDVAMNKVEEEDDWSSGNFTAQGFDPIQDLS